MRTYFFAILLCFAPVFAVFAQDSDDIRVMTFNIRLDTPVDSLHQWSYRKAEAAKLFSLEAVDIAGTQEVMKHQLDDLLAGAQAFASLGVGRADGKEAGEYSAIFYRKDRFRPERFGNFWLSETPEIAGSKGWDAACERIVSWAVFTDLKTNRQFLFMNTHFDHIGVQARKNSALLLIEKAAELAEMLPVIITGDFNGTPDSEPVEIMLHSGWLFDSKKLAKTTNGPEWSFHDFGRLPENERELIDFIFVNKKVEVKSYSNIFRHLGSTYYSDHNPVIVQLRLTE